MKNKIKCSCSGKKGGCCIDKNNDKKTQPINIETKLKINK